MSRLVPLENSPREARDFVDQHRLEVGHVLPPTEKTFKEYFPPDQSFLLHTGKRVTGIVAYRSGRDKQAPTAIFRAIADTPANLRQLVEQVEKAAVATEKTTARTTVFGYDPKKLHLLKALGYRTGATLSGTVSLDGKRYDYHILYKDLSTRYSYKIERSYAKPGLYPTVQVDKARTPS